jgi:hypothetical protein
LPSLDGDGDGVEGGCLDLDAGGGVPVVELVVVTAEDGGGRWTVAVLRFAHDDGADFAEETVCAVEEVEFGALDVELNELRRRGLVEE